MNDLRETLKKGSLLVIETGEYSDRSWANPVRMRKSATKSDLVDAFRAQWKPSESTWNDKPDPSEFLPWLVAAGWVEDVDNVAAWHVGSYGDFEP